MAITIEENARAIAYVVTSTYAMITAEIPVFNNTDHAIEFSLYNAAIDPEGQCLTTTETRYRLETGAHCMVTDELLRIRDPKDELKGYTITSSLCVDGELCDQKRVSIELV